MREQRVKRIPAGAIAAIAAGVLAAGGAGAWWAFRSTQVQTPAQVNTPNSLQPINPSAQPAIGQTAQIYWLRDTGTNTELVPTAVSVNSNQPSAVLEAAFEELLTGPTANNNVTSTIPQGTQLRSLRVQNNEIYVDLSSDFTSGGGSTSMSGRLAQVVYTATSLNPDARVWINVDGQKLEYLGGEGLELDQPLTRQSIQANFPL